MMSKRFRYFFFSLACALTFLAYISLTYEMRYFGLIVGIILVSGSFWFGLGQLRWLSIVLPVSLFVGYGLFTALLPYSVIGAILLSLFFGIICYVLFLVENVFMVAIGFKTVPLYRAAYTVSLMILLVTAFFLFDSLYSFRLMYWWNVILVFLVSGLLFLYQFWVITIELPDDGKTKNWTAYILVPAFLMSQLALVFSFWPVGIFKGSIYLVSVMYVISGLLQSDIRDRLFKRTWINFSYISLAIISAVVLMTGWR